MQIHSKYILLFSIVALSFSSCNDFLDRDPLAQVSQDNMFTSETNAQSAVIGTYRTLLGWFYYGESTIIVPEFSAQQVRHAAAYPEYQNFDSKTILVNNPWLANIWGGIYTTINAANNVIDGVGGMEESAISEEKRAQFINEAKFIRALSYFNLVRLWGRVPMLLTATGENDDLQVPQSDPEEIYAQIIFDLEDAATLPTVHGTTVETKGRATQYAAKALLAKVHLYQGSNAAEYAQAASLAKEVIDQGGFSLVQNYASIWSSGNTAEAVFELQFDEQIANTLATRSNPTPTLLFYAKDASVFNLFDENDARRDYTVYEAASPADPEVNFYYIGKYRQYQPATQKVPLIRLAEVFLIHAEAQARADNAVSTASYESFKAVRDRANLETPEINSLGSLEEYIQAIQQEKRKELLFEGETWFDYARTGLALTEFMDTPNENFLVYPIPEGELLVNTRLAQNPGY